MMELRRKHLADGTYFIWRCEHKNGVQDRAGDRNDGPEQGECAVEVADVAALNHRRPLAVLDLAEAMAEFHGAVDRVHEKLVAVLRLLKDP